MKRDLEHYRLQPYSRTFEIRIAAGDGSTKDEGTTSMSLRGSAFSRKTHEVEPLTVREGAPPEGGVVEVDAIYVDPRPRAR